MEGKQQDRVPHSSDTAGPGRSQEPEEDLGKYEDGDLKAHGLLRHWPRACWGRLPCNVSLCQKARMCSER